MFELKQERLDAPVCDGQWLKAGGLPALYAIWSEQPDGYFCLSLVPLSHKRFYDLWIEKRGKTFRQIGELPVFARKGEREERYESYFCVAAFSEPQRLKKLVLPSRWLFADLDYMPPHEVPITPTFSWETSPGKWQAIWYVRELLEPDVFNHMNRAVCHASGADPGTWNVNRLLRVPGSEHLKKQRAALEASADG